MIINLDDVARRATPSDYDCPVCATSLSTIAPWTERTMRFRTILPGLVLVHDEFDSKRRWTFTPAFRVADVVPRSPFLIGVANFSDRPLHVKQNKLASVARPADNNLVSQAYDSLLTIDDVPAMPNPGRRHCHV